MVTPKRTSKWERLIYEDGVSPGLGVARGRHPGISGQITFGENLDVDTQTVTETLWSAPGGGIYQFPTAPVSLEVLSDSSDDISPSGTGLHEVIVNGLDENGDVAIQVVTLNGTSVVAVPGTWTRVNVVIGQDAGSIGTNDGGITVRVAGGGDTLGYVRPNDGQSTQAVRTIPTGFTGYIEDVFGSTLLKGGSAGSARLGLYFRIPGQPTRLGFAFGVTNQVATVDAKIPFGFPEGTDVEMRAIQVSSNNTAVGGGWEIILVDNTLDT